MAQRQLTRRSPGGNVVSLSWDGAKPASEVAGIRFAGGSYGRGFQVHPRGAHDFACANVFEAKTTKRIVVGRNEVKVSTSADRRTTMATLIGAHHELMTIFQGPAPAAQVIGELFAVLDIDDAAEGMRVVPQKSTLLSVMNEHLVIVNEDTTSLDIPSASTAAQIVPRHKGAPTRHGEVWRTRLPGRPGKRAHDFTYVVGTPKGAADIIASSTEAVSDKELLDMVHSVNVVWTAGNGRGKGKGPRR